MAPPTPEGLMVIAWCGGPPCHAQGGQWAATGCDGASLWGPVGPRQVSSGIVLGYTPQQGPEGGHRGDHWCGGGAKHGPQLAPGKFQCERQVTRDITGWGPPQK